MLTSIRKLNTNIDEKKGKETIWCDNSIRLIALLMYAIVIRKQHHEQVFSLSNNYKII